MTELKKQDNSKGKITTNSPYFRRAVRRGNKDAIEVIRELVQTALDDFGEKFGIELTLDEALEDHMVKSVISQVEDAEEIDDAEIAAIKLLPMLKEEIEQADDTKNHIVFLHDGHIDRVSADADEDEVWSGLEEEAGTHPGGPNAEILRIARGVINPDDDDTLLVLDDGDTLLDALANALIQSWHPNVPWCKVTEPLLN
jgi:hypothetical protein